MKTYYSPYILEPAGEFSGFFKASKGLLLKFVSDRGEERYSLYHPIEGLGDCSVGTFLKDQEKRKDLLSKIQKLTLSSDKSVDQSVSSYVLAQSQRHLFKDAGDFKSAGFSLVKLKVQTVKDIDFAELEKLPFQYIFDFNGRESVENFVNLSDSAKDFLSKRVKYIEDPYEKIIKCDFELASDFIDYGGLAKYKIVKPTGFNHQLPHKSLECSNLVVTSYLDHPLGQVLSGLWAFEQGVSQDCGLWTHTIFKKNKYAELFKPSHALDLSVAADFVKLLEQEEWSEI